MYWMRGCCCGQCSSRWNSIGGMRPAARTRAKEVNLRLREMVNKSISSGDKGSLALDWACMTKMLTRSSKKKIPEDWWRAWLDFTYCQYHHKGVRPRPKSELTLVECITASDNIGHQPGDVQSPGIYPNVMEEQEPRSKAQWGLAVMHYAMPWTHGGYATAHSSLNVVLLTRHSRFFQ